jgi:hypothetical protein
MAQQQRKSRRMSKKNRKGGKGILTDIAVPALMVAVNTLYGKKKSKGKRTLKNKKSRNNRK